MELRFLKRGCLRSDNIAADRYHNLVTAKGTVFSSNNGNNALQLDRNPPIMSEDRDTPITNDYGGRNSCTQ